MFFNSGAPIGKPDEELIVAISIAVAEGGLDVIQGRGMLPIGGVVRPGVRVSGFQYLGGKPEIPLRREADVGEDTHQDERSQNPPEGSLRGQETVQ